MNEKILFCQKNNLNLIHETNYVELIKKLNSII